MFLIITVLEKTLHTPAKLQGDSNFQLEPQSRSIHIENYYSIDDSVAGIAVGIFNHRKDWMKCLKEQVCA